MNLDLYQAETASSAAAQAAIIEEARTILASRPLTGIEAAGMLHALQISVENAIGKAKHWLKARGLVVPVSAYDAFAALAKAGLIPTQDLAQWNALVGLRNRIVHDYMNLDLALIEDMISAGQEALVLDFLLRDLPRSY